MGLFGLRVSVQGLRQAQLAQAQLLAAVNPTFGLGKAVKTATQFLHKYAVSITHVQTGTLQASHRADFGAGRLLTTFAAATIRQEAVGRIYIDPNARNPVTGERPAEYGLLEHAKGGSHAFYARTYDEAGPGALALAHSVMMSELPKGGIIGGLISFGRTPVFPLPGT